MRSDIEKVVDTSSYLKIKASASIHAGLPDVAVLVVRLRSAKNASRTIPIVMASSGDPVVSGLVASLARPDGNVTGLTQMSQPSG